MKLRTLATAFVARSLGAAAGCADEKPAFRQATHAPTSGQPGANIKLAYHGTPFGAERH